MNAIKLAEKTAQLLFEMEAVESSQVCSLKAILQPEEAFILQRVAARLPVKFSPEEKEKVLKILIDLFSSNEKFGRIFEEIWKKFGQDFSAVLKRAILVKANQR